MKAVIVIDSFKGRLTSVQAGNAAAEGIKRVYTDAETIVYQSRSYTKNNHLYKYGRFE